MSFQFEREGETGVLTLTGSFNIEQASEFKTILLEKRKKIERIIVKLVDVEEVDLTWFQILCSAHRLFSKEKKVLIFSSESAEMAGKIFQRYGFARKNACGLDLNSDCLWIKGDTQWEK